MIAGGVCDKPRRSFSRYSKLYPSYIFLGGITIILFAISTTGVAIVSTISSAVSTISSAISTICVSTIVSNTISTFGSTHLIL